MNPTKPTKPSAVAITRKGRRAVMSARSPGSLSVAGKVVAPAAAASEVVMMDLALLASHPDQEKFNPASSPMAKSKLAASIAAEGQRDPIHVLPPDNLAGCPAYTILDGDGRWRALLSNGATTGKVIVRWDLLHADKAAVDLVFLGFNQNRRHYDPLALANNLRAQMQLTRPRLNGSLDDADKSELARTLADMLAMSPRNAFRYIHAAKAPQEIQNAHRNGHVRLTLAAQAGQLPKQMQDQLVLGIATVAPTEIEGIILKYTRRGAGRNAKRYTPVALRLVRNLKRDLADLERKFEKIHGPTLAPHKPFLVEAQDAIARLIAAAERPGASVVEAFEAAMTEKALPSTVTPCRDRT